MGQSERRVCSCERDSSGMAMVNGLMDWLSTVGGRSLKGFEEVEDAIVSYWNLLLGRFVARLPYLSYILLIYNGFE